jgi:hypothetical protein
MLEVMLDDSEGDFWVYRRECRIRRNVASLLQHGKNPLRHLAPEIQLLYKSKSTRPRDELDFRRALPRLTKDARYWLRDSLVLTNPTHPWLDQIERSG